MATNAGKFHQMTVTKTKRSLAGYKGHLTRTLKALEVAVAQCNNNPSQRLGKLIERYLQEADDKMDTIVAGYEHILETGSDPERNEAEAALDHEMERREKARTDAATALGKVPTLVVVPNADDKFAVKKDLRPQELTREVNPAELRAWVAQFKRYYRASRMKTVSIYEQRGYLNSCLSLNLQLFLNSTVEDDAEIFDADLDEDYDPEPTRYSCIGAIQMDFLARYPLASRRCNALKLRQPRGQPWATFRMKARETIEDAALEMVDRETLESIILINACTDEELKKLFLDKEGATVQDLDRIADNYERKMADVRGTTEIDKVYATTMPNSSKNNSAKPMQKKENKGLGCLRCGKANHVRKDCRKDANIVCNFCKIKGHMEQACNKKKSNEKKK